LTSLLSSPSPPSPSSSSSSSSSTSSPPPSSSSSSSVGNLVGRGAASENRRDSCGEEGAQPRVLGSHPMALNPKGAQRPVCESRCVLVRDQVASFAGFFLSVFFLVCVFSCPVLIFRILPSDPPLVDSAWFPRHFRPDSTTRSLGPIAPDDAESQVGGANVTTHIGQATPDSVNCCLSTQAQSWRVRCNSEQATLKQHRPELSLMSTNTPHQAPQC